MFNAKTRAFLDNQVYNWNSYPGQHYLWSHHIDGFPRLLFTSGISKLTELKADDKVGIMFCLVIAMLQTESRNMFLNESGITEIQH